MPLEVTVPNPNSLPTSSNEVQADIQQEVSNNITSNVRDPEVIKKALSTGVDEDTLANYMSQKGSMDIEEAKSIVINSIKSNIYTARDTGASNEEILNSMINNGYNQNLASKAMESSRIPTPWKALDFDPSTVEENSMDLADLYKNIHNKYSNDVKSLGILGEENAVQARKEINQLNMGLVQMLQERGFNSVLDPNSGEASIQDESGNIIPIDDSLLNSIWNSKGELAGSIAGAVAGAKVGAEAPGRAKFITVPMGTLAGGAAGAAMGRAGDLAMNSYRLKEKLSSDLYKQQMIEAGIFNGIMDVTGGAVMKAGAAGGKSIMRAYNFVVEGNTQGAVKALKENLHLSQDQVDELVSNFYSTVDRSALRERTAANKLSFGLINTTKEMGKSKQEALAILHTQPMAEAYIKKASAENNKVANALLLSINDRAKGLQKAIASYTDENTGNLIRQDLKAYRKDVKEYYGKVKDIAAFNTRGTDFTFDLDKLAIEPTLKDIESRIGNPRVRERFLNYSLRIESASKDRSFEGLIDLRQAVNEFKYGVKGLSKPDADAINTVLNKIDGDISRGAKEYIPEGKQWLEQFSKAKSEYSKMKLLEENTMYKALSKSTGQTENGIRRLLNKYGNDTDVDAETYNAIATKLTPKVRSKAEAAIIENLTQKYSIGEVTHFQAVDFPQLASELRKLNIETAEGKNLVNAVEEFSKIFKNDKDLASVTGGIMMPRMTQSLSSDVGAKLKYSIVGEVWDSLRTLFPGSKSNNAALIKLTGDLLEDPLKAKTVDKFLKEIPVQQRSKVGGLVKTLQIELAKNPGRQADKDFLKMYKQNAQGKLVETNGALGKGLYLVDKVKNPTPGANIISHEVNLSRMATLDNISELVGYKVTEKDLPKLMKDTQLKQQLEDAKYLGIRLEGKAMLFPETTKGAK